MNLFFGERRGSDWLYEIIFEIFSIYRENIDGSENIECLKTIAFFWDYYRWLLILSRYDLSLLS